MTLRVHPEADYELCEARCYYNSQQPERGDRFAGAVEKAFGLLEVTPEAGRRGRDDCWRLRLKDWPYALHYQIERDSVVIYAVGHLNRRPDYWKDRL